MKILQLSKYYPPTHGGLELVAEFFSRACVDNGAEVRVISFGDRNLRYSGAFGEKVLQSREDVKLKSSPLSWGYYGLLRDELCNNRPDVIFVHLPNPFAHELLKWFSSLIKELKIKVIGIYHSDIVNQVTLRDAYNFHFSQHLELYDYFICSSENLKNTSLVLSQLNSEKVRIIPFCVDHPFQEKHRSRPEKFQGKFLAIGRMVPYKGYAFLIECFKSLPYSLTIVGGGPLAVELKALAPSNVHFIGQVSEAEKFDLFAQHDALIVSSINRAEAYGMTIVEAFSVGLPVIASNIDTGVSFLVRDGLTGLKFQIKNETEFLTKIKEFAGNTTLRESLSRNGQDLFHSALNYETFKNNIKKFLTSI